MPEPRSVVMSFTLLSRILLFVAVLTSGSLFAQDDQSPGPRRGSAIVDDTTKQIYGPNTSKYFFEEDVFFNREVTKSIDTLIRNFHRYNYVQRFGYRYQDLGNVGTAIRPLYYETPDVIGKRSGMHVYDLYTETEPVKYYDTKSPYTNMKVVLGGLGRSITKATYSRNITPQWNFGINYRALLIDKNLQRSGRADRLVRGTYYDLYTTYQSKDSTYRIFGNVRRNFHRVEEFGGVRDLRPVVPGETPTPLPISDYYLETAQPWLTRAESNDLRSNYHVFHQYSIAKPLQVYHVFDRYRQRNKFIDIPDESTKPFFGDFIEIERDTTTNDTKFKAVRNEVGLKGNVGKLFLNGYYAIRHYSMSYISMRADTGTHMTFDSLRFAHIGNEHYVGGKIAFNLDSIGEVRGGAEIMQDPDISYEGKKYYRIYGQINSKWFDASVTQMQYAPGFMEQAYRGTYNKWNNFFSNTTSTQFNGHLHYRSKVLTVSPGVTFTRLSNYVFYKKVSDSGQRVMPVQSTGQQVILSPELSFAVTFFKHITLSGQGIYTELAENADNALSIPKIHVNTQLAYSNIFFNGNFDIHTGVDVHWRSAYNAMGYDVPLRQFYIQNDFQVHAHPIVDLFLNAKIKRGRVFLKYHNLMQAFTKQGYMPTPGYPGQPNSFEFGFDWSFYD
ncbi:MAG TPA: putative porin [Chryseosolibacter sp.]